MPTKLMSLKIRHCTPRSIEVADAVGGEIGHLHLEHVAGRRSGPVSTEKNGSITVPRSRR
jgi:hypothetical protein